MKSRTIAITMAYPIMKTIVHKGYDVEQFCQYACFYRNLLQDIEARMTGDELEQLIHAAASYTQDEHFGLHQGQLMEFADMGVLGYVMVHSNKILDALNAYRRYNLLLFSGFHLEWESMGEDVRLHVRLQSNGMQPLSRHCAEDMLSSLHQLMGKLCNQRIKLKEVQFAHEAPLDQEPYYSIFGCQPSFGQAGHYLYMDRKVLEYPIMYSDSRMLSIFEAVAEEARNKMIQEDQLADQVYHWLKKSFPQTFPTVLQTAEAFEISARTLQHKLKEANTSYNEIAIQVRKELAIQYLKSMTCSIGEIAYALHFSEPSAFQNAFKKWMGVTPGQFRKGITQEV